LPFRIGSVAGRGPAESKSKPLAYIIAFDSHALRHHADADSHTDPEPDRDTDAYRNADPHGFAHSGEAVRPTLTNSRSPRFQRERSQRITMYIPNLNFV
jgi:hypothetical protein